MPVALETTKRKFHNLLDNLTKPPPTSLSDAPSMLNQPAAKRVRLEPRTRHPRPTSTISLVSSRDSGDVVKATASSSEPSKPYYVPWSHEFFLQRLKTFADVTMWSPKPDNINEVAWAKRGWTCAGINTVACKGGCEQRVVVGLRPRRKDTNGEEIADSEDYGVEVDDELVRRYVDILETGHDEECLWRHAGCKDDIFRLPIARPSVWQSQLRDRYTSFHRSTTHLPPPPNLTHPLALDEVASQLPNSIYDTPDRNSTTASTPPNPTSLAFALLGWSCSADDPSYPIAACSACFRRLGLWLYTPSHSASFDPTATEESPRANTHDDTTMKLDLITNHRDYCPWINATSQSMPGTFAGLEAWRILLRLVQNNAVEPRPASVVSFAPTMRSTNDAVETASVENLAVDGATGQVKSRDTVEKEDKVRFARIKELTRSMTFKGRSFKSKLGAKKSVPTAVAAVEGVVAKLGVKGAEEASR